MQFSIFPSFTIKIMLFILNGRLDPVDSPTNIVFLNMILFGHGPI